MYRILKIGLDVHTTNFTLGALESKLGEDKRYVPLSSVTLRSCRVIGMANLHKQSVFKPCIRIIGCVPD